MSWLLEPFKLLLYAQCDAGVGAGGWRLRVSLLLPDVKGWSLIGDALSH